MNRLTPSPLSSSQRANGSAEPEQQYHQQQQNGTGVQHRLTPQEAALRGASLAFQKTGGGGNGLGRQTTGGSNTVVSRQPTGSSVRSQQQQRDDAVDRERKALFLSPATPEQGTKRPGAGPTTEGKSASFIAATLAASRSVSPGQQAVAGSSTTTDGGLGARRRSAASLGTRQSQMDLRRGSAASEELTTDTTSLAPATSLISLFEARRRTGGEPAGLKGSPQRPPVERKLKSTSPIRRHMTNDQTGQELERSSEYASDSLPSRKHKTNGEHSGNNDSPSRRPQLRSSQAQEEHQKFSEEKKSKEGEVKSKMRPSPKPKSKVATRAETPPPPVIRRASPVIVSPKPRRPETKPRLKAPAVPIDDNILAAQTKAKSNIKGPKPKPTDSDTKASAQPTDGGNQTARERRPSIPAKSPAISIKSRPPAPRKSSSLSERLSPELKRLLARRHSVVSNHDGQEESKVWARPYAATSRPTTSDSKSSNDSFVSASSVLNRDDGNSMLTVEAPSSQSITPRASASPSAYLEVPPALPMRRSVTGSSQLPLDSLSDAIMAGSLASARHTPISLYEGRTPPPLPPSRKKGAMTKNKGSSRRTSPHRMKHTLRQPKSLSDDEDARRPQQKKGINYKKHAHHEGERSRWREEITDREKKRYEAVWASNRGALLVASAASLAASCSDRANHPVHKPLRDEGYEELSEHVANVVVRDLWRRSRLPEPELAEVWDLVYGRGRTEGPGLVHGALNKQEFVVGMWLIDQRLRGRKIPPRVSDSVWHSAKGLKVISPGHAHGHGHGHGHSLAHGIHMKGRAK